MAEYDLQRGEALNGGYVVTIGSFTLRSIGAYKVSWAHVYDSANSFQDYKGNEVKPLLGARCSIDITTGKLSAADASALITALRASSVSVVCPDFTGNCRCDNAPAELKQANFLNTRYSLSFTLVAESITPADGL